MNFLRKHWYDIGAIGALVAVLGVLECYNRLSHYQFLMWCSLITLLLHQSEEYRIIGTFPGMLNRVMFKSALPDRYPLNTNTAFIINVFLGWSFYLLAALVAEKAVWLGMATILISSGNIIAHTFIFNIKGKMVYNAGLATSWLLFAPCVFYFFKIIHAAHLVTLTDYLIGIPLGITMNVLGILKLISWLADKNTPYLFEKRNLLPVDR